jgi:hypothetical protein
MVLLVSVHNYVYPFMFISAAHKHLNQSRKRAHNMLGISITSKVGRNLTSLRAKATWKAGGLPKGNGNGPFRHRT